MIKLQDRIVQILAALNEVPGDVKVIAIDGRCASGKTMLTEELARITGAGVIHMDDFFLPKELRTAERLKEPGGNVHYERFAEEVLPVLKSAMSFSYRRFDCSRMDLGEKRTVPAGILRIVEGSYSCHPRFGNYMGLRVFCDVAPLVQRSRVKNRNGEEALKDFLGKWIPMEEKYFAAYRIKEKADVVV